MNYGDESQDARTLFCGNLPAECTEELLYELFLQVGPVEKVRIPNDREGRPLSYGFIMFKHQCSVEYAINVFEGIMLFKNKLNLRLRNSNNAPMSTPMFNQANNTNMAPNYGNYPSRNNRTPSGRKESKNEYYRNESLQGRWNNSYKRDRNMKPNDNHRNNYKRHKR